MMNIWHDIDAERVKKEDFMAVVEIPAGSKCKYELDKETGMLMLDRVLYTSVQYPANYGFIPKTYAEDGDPLDVLILCSQNICPLTLVRCYPIGVLEMVDDDEKDQKIIAIPFKEPGLNTFTDVCELPKHRFEELRHFFEVYKNLEGKVVTVDDILGAADAKEVIEECMDRYNKKFGNREENSNR